MIICVLLSCNFDTEGPYFDLDEAWPIPNMYYLDSDKLDLTGDWQLDKALHAFLEDHKTEEDGRTTLHRWSEYSYRQELGDICCCTVTSSTCTFSEASEVRPCVADRVIQMFVQPAEEEEEQYDDDEEEEVEEEDEEEDSDN